MKSLSLIDNNDSVNPHLVFSKECDVAITIPFQILCVAFLFVYRVTSLSAKHIQSRREQAWHYGLLFSRARASQLLSP